MIHLRHCLSDRKEITRKGARVLITGASSGIGKALAFEFAQKGAILTLTSRRRSALHRVAVEIQERHPNLKKPLVVSCDISKNEDVERLIACCVEQMGGIDILINNAGISVYGKTDRTTLQDFHSVMDVNFFGSLHCIFGVLPYMKKRGKGLIVNIASVAALHGVPYLGAYGASKAALSTLCQSLRAEWLKYGIEFMLVYPDYTQSEIFRNEKKVGGACRQPGPYTPANKVAETIVDSIEGHKKEVVLSLRGKALKVLQGIHPNFVDKKMVKIADRLEN